MALHARCAADDNNGSVKHRKRALQLGRKIGMAGGVKQRERPIAHRHDRLLGKDGDAPAALQRKGIKKGVLMVNAPQCAQRARQKEHGL